MAYIGVQPAEAYTSFAVQHFTTSATTSYTLDNPVANENEIALFINNVRQEPGSSYAYTASGTTLTLSAATSASDTMYCVFIGKAVQTVTPTLPIANFSSTGIDDNATSTAITIDSSENVGIGTASPNKDGITKALTINSPIATNYSGIELSTADTLRTALISNSNGGYLYTATDIPLVFQTNNVERARFTSAGLHLGGTGSANALDDYEEGTFTPVFESTGGGESVTHNIQQGNYTKIGRLVSIQILIRSNSYSGGSGTMAVRGLPFASFSGYQQGISCNEVAAWNTNAPTTGYISPGATRVILAYINVTTMVGITPSNMNTGSNSNLVGIHATYFTN